MWDFNNDGIPDSQEQNPTTTFAEPGTYLVSLRVTYPDGQTVQSEGKPVTIAPITGVVSVDLGPVLGRATAGRWKLSSQAAWQETGAIIQDVTYGSYTLEFLPVTGWTAPANIVLTFSPDTPYQILDLRYTRIVETYAEWQVKVFGAAAGNPAVSGELADPDHDGIVNLIEYATGSDPQALQSRDVLAVQSVPGNPAGVSISFARNLKAQPDTELTLEESDFLSAWISVQPLSPVETLTSDHVSRLTFTIPQDQARRFYRLRVSKP